MDQEKDQQQSQGNKSSYQEELKKEYSPIEEEYHQAYPDRPALWTSSAFMGIFSKFGKGFLTYAVIGAGIALLVWIAFMFVTGGRPS